MKKSQLRNIIRESIKGLMNEQAGVYHKWQGACSTTTGIVNFFMGGSQNTPQTNQNFYQQVGSPSVGETVGNFSPPLYWSGGTNQCYTYRGSSPNPKGGNHGSFNVSGWNHTQWHGPYPAGHANCLVCYGTTSCDTSPSTACATQWFQNPNANWASNWINSKDCSNYTWPAQNLEQQALNIMAGAPNQNPAFMGGYSGYQDIWDAGNNSGLVSPQKQRFIAKMAKSMFAQCQIQNCC